MPSFLQIVARSVIPQGKRGTLRAMNKFFGAVQRSCVKAVNWLRPIVDYITTGLERQSPHLRDTWLGIKKSMGKSAWVDYDYKAKLWTPLANWLTVVTWKRLFVVGVLLLATGGMVSSCMENWFTSRSRVTVTEAGDEKDGSKPSARQRNVQVRDDGIVITDKASGKTVTVSFDGVVTKSADLEKRAEVSAQGVVVVDPETGKRVRFGPNGAVPVEEGAVPPPPPLPPEPAVPPVAAQPAHSTVTTAAAATKTINLGNVKVVKNADGTRSLGLGPIRITLPKGVTDADIAEAESDIREAIRDIEAAKIEANAEAQAVREEAMRMREDAMEAAREAKENAEEIAADNRKSKKSQRVVTINGPNSISDAVMPLLATLLFFAVLAKVILNTRSKAAATVAKAKQETERESLERQLAEAQLTTMQAQVEPHFLFNTLGSVEYLIESDPKRAAQMQRHLIAYLRAAMPHMRDSTSNMGRESQLISSFLEILQFRMEERLAFSVQVPRGLHSAEFPPMMLLSVVENCIKHGLEPKPEGGRIDVLAEVHDGKLRVTVADTGMGYQAGGAATSGTRVGLANIRERLNLLFGAAASIDIRANLPAGTVVSIELPYKVGNSST